jgi:hypothetical protein
MTNVLGAASIYTQMATYILLADACTPESDSLQEEQPLPLTQQILAVLAHPAAAAAAVTAAPCRFQTHP